MPDTVVTEKIFMTPVLKHVLFSLLLLIYRRGLVQFFFLAPCPALPINRNNYKLYHRLVNRKPSEPWL